MAVPRAGFMLPSLCTALPIGGRHLRRELGLPLVDPALFAADLCADVGDLLLRRGLGGFERPGIGRFHPRQTDGQECAPVVRARKPSGKLNPGFRIVSDASQPLGLEDRQKTTSVRPIGGNSVRL